MLPSASEALLGLLLSFLAFWPRTGLRMDKSSTECKECIANHYWNHMGNRKKRFFKPMIGDFRNGVAIPEKFVRNVGRQISEVVKLETPDGNTHNVQVAKELNNLVLRSGWSSFDNVYELEEGDFLVFKYCGDSRFKVEIYGPTACEKELSCVAMKHTPVKDRSIPCDDQMRSPQDKRFAKNDNGSCSHSWKTSEMNSATSPSWFAKHCNVSCSHSWKTSEMNSATSPSWFAKHCNVSCSHSWKTSEMNPATSPSQIPSIQVAVNSDELQTSTRTCYVLATGCNLTKEHKAEVNKLAHKIWPEIPLYVKSLDRSSLVDGSLVICKDYAIKYLPREDEIITLCHASNSKTWSAHFKIKTNGTYILNAGWFGFVHDNELREGDCCMFEVSKIQRSFTVTVHLLRASYNHPPGFLPSTKSLKPQDNVKVTRFTTLTDVQKTKIYEKVEAIQSEIPIFVSVIKRSSEANSLSFSLDYARDNLPDKCQTMRLHRPGERTSWKVSFVASGGRRWLRRGWKLFAHDNKLKPGDVCLMELMKRKKKLRMMVHIIRKEEFRR